MNTAETVKLSVHFESAKQSSIFKILVGRVFSPSTNNRGRGIVQHFYITMESYLHIHFCLIYTELIQLTLLPE